MVRHTMRWSPVALLFASLQMNALAHEGPGSHAHAATQAVTVMKHVRTGNGMHTYESVPQWCELPADFSGTLGSTHGGILVDRQGSIYFNTDQQGRAVLVYSPEGKLQRMAGGGYAGIHSMVLREEDGAEYIYAAHLRGQQVLKLSLDGDLIWKLTYDDVAKSNKYENLAQYKPTAVAVGPDGDIYIADGYGQNWIHQFDASRQYVRSFGGRGKEPGQFQTCHGLALDTRGDRPLLLVCDRENRRLQHFDLEGNFVEVVTTGLRRPCSVSFHGGHVAVAELEGRVTILDESNQPVAFLGDNPNSKQWANFRVTPDDWQEAIFTAPHSVCFDQQGNLYVMDWNASGRLSRLNRVVD